MAGKNGKKPAQNMKQAEAAKRSNLADWWASQFTELDLPSGLHVTVRDIDIEDLLANGSLPNTLISIFPEFQGMDEEEATKKMVEEHPESFADLMNAVVQSCLVEPQIGETRDIEKGILTLADIRGRDKMFLFEWANREVKQVTPFRAGEDEPAQNS